MKNLTAPLALALWALGTTAVVAEQTRACATRDTVVNRLANKYGETRQSIGIGADNSVMELFASPETGSWTITLTYATGMTCLVATGKDFETLAKKLPVLSEKDA